MQTKAQTIFNSLSIFVLGTALFLLQPTQTPKVMAWQDNVKHQFSRAFIQTVGDGPWFEDLEFVYDTINNFYELAAEETIALLKNPQVDEDIAFVFGKTYQSFAQAFNQNQTSSEALANFMTEEPLYNLVPEDLYSETVASDFIVKSAEALAKADKPVNSVTEPWVTMLDNLTGQVYCVAIYNGTVNKYLGPCKYDYH